MSNDVPSGEIRPDISIGRGDAAEPAVSPQKGGSGHPLPASEKARHDSIPEQVVAERGYGAN